MSQELVPEGQLLPVILPRWDITVPFVRIGDDGPLYVAIRPMCEQLEIDTDTQMKKIWGDERLNEEGVTIVEIRVPTRGGRQTMWCLRKVEAATWVGDISAKKVKASCKGRLQEVQQDLKAYADRLIFGDLSDVSALSLRPARGGVLDVGACPKCATHLHYVVTERETFLQVADDPPSR